MLQVIKLKKSVILHAVLHAILWMLCSWVLFLWMNSHVLMHARVSSSLSDLGNTANFPLLEVLLFLIGQMLAYGLLSAVIFLLAYPILIGFSNKISSPRTFIHFIGLTVVYSCLLLHQYLFPTSAHPLAKILPISSLSMSHMVIYALPVVAFLALGLFCSRFWLSKVSRYRLRYLLFGALLLGTFFLVLKNKVAPHVYAGSPTNSQPNIILIGVDSFSLDMFDKAESTSFLKSFTDEAVVFSDTKTPLARTYAAWMSLLSASYPTRNGVRFNLFPRTEEQQSKMLLGRFKQAGYQIYYGSDERRFSNLDTFHGFDGVIGPPIGAMDFLLGGMVDMPFTNLLLATPLGRYIFPYSYSNRAVAHAYEYHDYLNLMDDTLDGLAHNSSPLFLATHLCLGHWPYYHRTTSGNESKSRYSLYQKSVATLDQMAGELYENLSKRGLLDNAVVILISDHGEGFPDKYKNFSGLRPPSSYGHGTNLLDSDQNDVLFAMQYFKEGKAQLQAETLDYPASLIDVLPTVAGVLDFDWGKDRSLDGLNLYPLVSGEAHNLPKSRPRFLETEIHLQSISGIANSQDIDVGSVLGETAKYYRVAEDGRLELNTLFLAQLLKEKDRAVELGGVYLTWSGDREYQIYDERTMISSHYDPVLDIHRQLMSFFCDHFERDIDDGYVSPNLCNVMVTTPR